jgi:ABC-type amino acid transport substrate-binding protein
MIAIAKPSQFCNCLASACKAFFRGKNKLPTAKIVPALLCLSLPVMLFGVPVKAGIHINPPFVMTDDRSGQSELYYGMAMDIWNLVADNLGVETDYIRFRSMEELIAAAESGDIDVIVTNLTVTHERTKQVKFTWPWYDAGLRIIIHRDGPADSLWEVMKKKGQITSYLVLFTGLIAACFVITLIRRKLNPAFPRSWRDGVSFSFHDLIFALSDRNLPEGFAVKNEKYVWLWKIFSALWTLGCVGLVAYVTSTVTSAMTTVSLSSNEIHSIHDLAGKKTGVIGGSPSEILLRNSEVNLLIFDEIEDASAALCSGSIDAVVADSPVLEYRVHRYPESNLRVVGEIFKPDKYAFGVSLQRREFADRISSELIKLIELGKVEELRSRYFGKSY